MTYRTAQRIGARLQQAYGDNGFTKREAILVCPEVDTVKLMEALNELEEGGDAMAVGGQYVMILPDVLMEKLLKGAK
jgi:hypothetical protein